MGPRRLQELRMYDERASFRFAPVRRVTYQTAQQEVFQVMTSRPDETRRRGGGGTHHCSSKLATRFYTGRSRDPAFEGSGSV